MSDNISPDSTGGTSSDANGVGSSGDTGNQSDSEFVSKSEHDELLRRLESTEKANRFAQSKKKEAEKELGDLRAEVDALKSAAAKSGDSQDKDQAIANATKQINELKAQIASRDGELRNLQVKSVAFQKVSGFIDDQALETWWAVEGHKFDLVDDGQGGKFVGIKDAPYMTIDGDYKNQLKESHPFLLKNQRAGGTGAATKPDANSSKGDGRPSVEALRNMDEKDRIVAMSKDPSLMKEYSEAMRQGK